MYVLWFNFNLGTIWFSPCFIFVIIYLFTIHQNKGKYQIVPKVELNRNLYSIIFLTKNEAPSL